MKQVIAGVAAAMLVIAGLAIAKYLQIQQAIAAHANMKPPPETVTSYVAKAEEWPYEIEAVGTLAPVNGALLAAEDLGRVVKIRFDPGSEVQAGAILAELDTSVERAELQAAEAKLSMNTTERERQKTLRGRGANSQSDLDNAEASYKTAAAEVARLRAVISRKTIVAPFDGRTGVRLVNEGEVIQPGTPVVSLQALDKLFLNFSLPQRVVTSLRKGSPVRFSADAIPGEVLKAVVDSVDPQVDERTRNVKIQALVENKGERLRPGMFVSLTVSLPGSEQVVSIPSSAVAFAPYGDTVFVIEDMKDPQGATYRGVRQQNVKLGRRRGDLIAVLSGLKPGEEVVSSGVFKLRPNAAVQINNSVTPASELAPRPADT